MKKFNFPFIALAVVSCIALNGSAYAAGDDDTPSAAIAHVAHLPGLFPTESEWWNSIVADVLDQSIVLPMDFSSIFNETDFNLGPFSNFQDLFQAPQINFQMPPLENLVLVFLREESVVKEENERGD